jgi:hypothetical protein
MPLNLGNDDHEQIELWCQVSEMLHKASIHLEIPTQFYLASDSHFHPPDQSSSDRTKIAILQTGQAIYYVSATERFKPLDIAIIFLRFLDNFNH